MNPHIKVTVEGGSHSGKSQLASSIHKTLSKNKLYGVQLVDDGHTSRQTDGPVKVLIETLFNDAVLKPGLCIHGPEQIAVGMAELKAAMLVWELERRQGLCMDQGDLDILPAGQVAEESAKKLWSLINKDAEMKLEGLL